MLINVRLLSLFYGTYGCMQLHCLMYWVLEWLYGESVQFRTLYPVSNSGTLDSVCCLRFLFPLSIGWWVTLGSKEPAWFFQFCSLWWFLVVIWFDFVLDAILIFGFCALVSTLWLFYCAAECYVCVFVVLCIIGFRLSPLFLGCSECIGNTIVKCQYGVKYTPHLSHRIRRRWITDQDTWPYHTVASRVSKLITRVSYK